MNWIARIDFNIIKYLQKAAQAALVINQSPQDLHQRLMDIHWNSYELSGDEKALQSALEHVEAYFWSGYKLRDVNSVSDKIAKAAGYQSVEDYLHSNHYEPYCYLRSFSKYVIDDVLGKGYASETRIGMKRSDVINQIINRIIEGKYGTYCYIIFDCKRAITSMTYLLIKENGVFLQNNFGVEYKLLSIPQDKKLNVLENENIEISFSSPDYIYKAVLSSLLINERNETIHKELLSIYWRYHENLGDQIYLQFALEHLSVYVESGFALNDLDDSLTNKILTAAGFQSIDDFAISKRSKIKTHRVHLSRNIISDILGAGYSSKSRKGTTREDIIDDIIHKISHRVIGSHCYTIYDSMNRANKIHVFVKENTIYIKGDLGNIYEFF